MPSVVKLKHHHEYFNHLVKSEKQFRTFHEKCIICSFEFSSFLSEKTNIDFAKIKLTDNYISCLKIYHYSDLSKYLFLLRAPPVFTNNIHIL